MSIFFIIFEIFFKLGFFSFGGGYVMIPMIERELTAKGIALMPQDIANITAIAGMSPGPVAVNAAVGFGYKVGGVLGMLSAALGVALPCAIIVVIVAAFFFKIYENKTVQSALYGLRPVITGIIAYAAINMAMKNGMLLSQIKDIPQKGWNFIAGGTHIFDVKSMVIAIGVFILLAKTKVHPIIIILSTGILGIFMFI